MEGSLTSEQLLVMQLLVGESRTSQVMNTANYTKTVPGPTQVTRGTALAPTQVTYSTAPPPTQMTHGTVLAPTQGTHSTKPDPTHVTHGTHITHLLLKVINPKKKEWYRVLQFDNLLSVDSENDQCKAKFDKVGKNTVYSDLNFRASCISTLLCHRLFATTIFTTHTQNQAQRTRRGLL